MATYTSNYGWTKPSGSDNVDISVLNDNLDDQDSTIHDAFLNMAPPFSESSTYAVDDIVLYATGLYKCHTAVVTPGSWTGSTNWQVYKLSEGGGGGTSNYNDLTNKPSINGVTLSGNKTTSDLGIDKTAVGLSNVPNVSTNDQTPTFTEASTRNNIASGEKLSVIMGKIAKFFNDLKTVAFSGSYTDLSSQPQINSNTLTGNKTTSDLGINADNVMLSDGVTSVEDALDEVKSGLTNLENGTKTLLGKIQVNESIQLPATWKRLYMRVNISDYFYGSINEFKDVHLLMPFSVTDWACTIQVHVENNTVSFFSETTIAGTKNSAWTTFVEIYYS